MSEQALAKPPPAPRNGLKGVKAAFEDPNLPRLTRQQFAFVEALADGANSYTEALEIAYPSCKTWARRQDVWSAASRLASHPKVREWLNVAWQAQQRAVDRTINGHVQRLETMQFKALDKIDKTEDRDKAALLKTALEIERQHARALGLVRDDGSGKGSLTVNLVSFQGEVEVDETGRKLTVRSPKPTD